ncbi:phytanoyl-CoA dioxygenase family protein, partial [Aeromicrobium sp.]|uniref:phytanoyl-CoA dioxygenase family protein n=1 Tax=Aeromicrobium sp. TaxID=1871063 RepID=UPI0028A7B4BE
GRQDDSQNHRTYKTGSAHSWQRIPAIERFARESGVARVAGELMGARQVRLYHDHVLVKEPGTRQRTPWHQDQPYYNVAGAQNVSMWFPVDPVARESTLEFVAGSHLGPWFMPRTFLDDQAKWFPEGSLAELPDIDAHPEEFRVLGWELEPGDAVFFNMATLHAAGGVSGTNRRRVLSLRFLGEEMRHAPRAWTTSPPFPGLEDELPDGAPLDHPLFPVLWERAA